MWETICEASASCSGINLCSKIPVYLILGFCPVCHPPPPPWKLKFGQDFEFWLPQFTPQFSDLVQFTPPPLKIKILPGLGTLSFDHPSLPPENWNFRQDLALLSFAYHSLHTNWNLARTWHFEFWLPPPPRQEFQGARMWRLISVSPVDTISLPIVDKNGNHGWKVVCGGLHLCSLLAKFKVSDPSGQVHLIHTFWGQTDQRIRYLNLFTLN